MDFEILLGQDLRDARRALLLFVVGTLRKFGIVDKVCGDYVQAIPDDNLENLERFIRALDYPEDECPELRYAVSAQLFYDVVQYVPEVPDWYVGFLRHWRDAALEVVGTGEPARLPRHVTFHLRTVSPPHRVALFFAVPYDFCYTTPYFFGLTWWFTRAWRRKAFRDLLCWKNYVHADSILQLVCTTGDAVNTTNVAFLLGFFSRDGEPPASKFALETARAFTEQVDPPHYVACMQRFLLEFARCKTPPPPSEQIDTSLPPPPAELISQDVIQR